MINWAIGFDMYTLMCIKLMTNKNLLYKKIKLNLKIKKKRYYLYTQYSIHSMIQFLSIYCILDPRDHRTFLSSVTSQYTNVTLMIIAITTQCNKVPVGVSASLCENQISLLPAFPSRTVTCLPPSPLYGWSPNWQ